MKTIEKEDVVFRKWKTQVNYFKKIKSSLLRKTAYRNKFVAIKDKKVVDVDEDKFHLFRRMNMQYPQDVFLVVKVQPGQPVTEVPSVELTE